MMTPGSLYLNWSVEFEHQDNENRTPSPNEIIVYVILLTNLIIIISPVSPVKLIINITFIGFF